MEIDKLKLERQYIGVDRYFNAGQVGCLNYYTGVGKTFTALLILKRLFKFSPNEVVRIIVPSDALVLQWRIQLSKFLTPEQLTQVDVYTASQVLVNNIREVVDTIVVDELHLFLGEEFIKTIDGTYIKSTHRLGLTATYKDPQGRHTVYETLFPIVDIINEAEAIEKGFVAQYVEYNLAVDFTDEEQIQYDRHTEIIKNTINKLGKKPLDLAGKILGGGTYKGVKYTGKQFVYGYAKARGWRPDLNLTNETDQKIDNLWNPSKIFAYAKYLMNSIRFRKDLLYNTESKTTITVDIIERFLGEKTIVFGEKTIYADKVNALINEKYPGYSVAYHSNVATQIRTNPKTGKPMKFGKLRLKKEAIEFIKNGKARCINTASALDSGFDVDDILIAIIGSGTANFNKQKQRKGRAGRKVISDVLSKDKVKLIINLYVRGTQDQIWLKKRQSESTNTIHWIDSVEEIVYNPIDKKEFKINTI